MTRFSFHTRVSLRVHKRLVTSNLLCKALMYALDVRDARVHVRNAHAKFGLRVHANYNPRTVE